MPAASANNPLLQQDSRYKNPATSTKRRDRVIGAVYLGARQVLREALQLSNLGDIERELAKAVITVDGLLSHPAAPQASCRFP